MTDQNDPNDQENSNPTEDKTASQPHHPHDSYFKRAMSYHEIAYAFFKKFLPQELLAQVIFPP